MPDSSPSNLPSCWVLAAPGAGDQRQLLTLAGQLCGGARGFEDIDGIATVLADRVSGAARRPLSGDKAGRYAPPWPDLVLIAGGRSVVDARRIRKASGHRSRIVAIGRPWAAYAPLDLIVTTPQYRLPSAGNVVEIPLPLNAPPPVSADARERLRAALARVEAPTVGVLLGGNSGSFRFGPRAIERISGRLTDFVDASGAPAGALDALRERLGDKVTLLPWAPDAVNPYPAVLADCDALAVTGDSASMLAEACLSGKPVAVLPLHPRRRSVAARAVGALVPESTRNALTRRGLWLPARDLPRLHAVAASHGWVRSLDRLLDRPVETPPSLETLLAPVRERIEALLRG